MSNYDIRAKARQDLGSNLFSTQWMSALAVSLIYTLIVGALSAIPAVGSIASLLLSGSLVFGISRYYTKLARNETPTIDNLFDGFKLLIQNFFLAFMMSLFVFLWSLLFIIPGIIKAYAYSMAFYIKQDHPEYEWKECLDESQRMMDGHKADLFLLQLSFIGWMILCIFTAGIGFLWLEPYMQAAQANFYNELVGGASDSATEEPVHDTDAVYETDGDAADTDTNAN